MTNLWTRNRSRRLASPGDILPVELWELIFRHIELDPELLRLARVCSTFNAVSIRLLLARHGQAQDVFDSPSLQLSVHTLPALYLSLQSLSATRVACSLDRAKTRWNIHLLDALLTRTPNLRRLDLEFDHDLRGRVFIFLGDKILSWWPRGVVSSDRGTTTKTGAWVKRIRERFGRTKSTTGKIPDTGLLSLRAVSIQLVKGDKDPPCRLYGVNIPAVDIDSALVHVALPSLRRVVIRTNKANPTALRTFLANHPQVSDITYDVPDEVLTSTHKLIDPPLAHPTLALFTSATDVLGSAHLLCGLQDSPNLYEFTFSFPGGTLTPERLALLLEDLRLVAARTRDTKLTLGVWDRQYRAPPEKFWASEEEARDLARAMHAVRICFVRTSELWCAREMLPWLGQLPSAAEIHFEVEGDMPGIDSIPEEFNFQEGIPEFLEEARAALVGVRDIDARRADFLAASFAPALPTAPLPAIPLTMTQGRPRRLSAASVASKPAGKSKGLRNLFRRRD
ncbi:hypothetical protein B0H14DRAFT_3468547 [Mycena olivaceomarginata]|nr:hypothetical protein B0H14DRAFT_3468547 [Mycena olivaceomarginata]